jgi:CheY-like chemotaxis protein
MAQTIDILIAEDDENDRLLVSRAFARNSRNMSLAFASDGQELVDMLQSSQEVLAARLLLLDLKMPRMDGFQVLEWLRQHPVHRPNRIIVLSSSVDPRDAERSRSLGADLHLTKPHDSREYVRIATNLLQDIASTFTPIPPLQLLAAYGPQPP